MSGLGMGVPWTIKTLGMGKEPTFLGAKVGVLVLFDGSLVLNR